MALAALRPTSPIFGSLRPTVFFLLWATENCGYAKTQVDRTFAFEVGFTVNLRANISNLQF
jgi:hypothetical protein